jgi:uncharacterized protein with FMN-binding domain
MRRGPTLVMCAVTGLVVVTNLRAGAGTGLPGAAVEPSGVVLLSPAGGPTSPPVRRSAPRTSPRAKRPAATATGTRTPTHATTPTSTRTQAAAPKPVRTAAPRPSSTRPKATSVVVNGRGVDTRYGVVQVQITISGHRIVRADAIAYPHGSGQTNQISSYSIPKLDSETVSAQSARIDTVSGATYTSEGYRTSLQSALDSAHAAGAW